MICIAPLGMFREEVVDFRLDGGLQHSLSSCADQFVERTRLPECGAKRNHLRIELRRWTFPSFCRNLSHGVSSVPSSGR